MHIPNEIRIFNFHFHIRYKFLLAYSITFFIPIVSECFQLLYRYLPLRYLKHTINQTNHALSFVGIMPLV